MSGTSVNIQQLPGISIQSLDAPVNPLAGIDNGSVKQKVDINIEAPFVKIVYECIVKTFKSHKKFIEKEVNLVVTKINSIKKQGSTKGAQSVIDSIDQLITKLNQLKSKYNKLLEAEDYLFTVLKKRLQHLNNMNENQSNPEIMRDYFTKRLNRIVIDYLLRENFFEAAQAFIDETGLKEFADVEVFEETSKIIQKLKQRDCSDALSWCNTHKTKLQKSNSQLEFRLRIQEFMQYIQTNDKTKAIEYARKQLNKFGDDQQMLSVIQQIMIFLMIRNEQKDKFGQFKDFSNENKWSELEELFLKESYSLFQLPEQALISQTLQTGIPILKTEFCPHDDNKSQSCPTCSLNLRVLGQRLPVSHQAQTSITCIVTGEVMNDQNQPYFIPSGHLVSERALKVIKDPSNPQQVICPFTHNAYQVSLLQKVYFS